MSILAVQLSGCTSVLYMSLRQYGRVLYSFLMTWLFVYCVAANNVVVYCVGCLQRKWVEACVQICTVYWWI